MMGGGYGPFSRLKPFQTEQPEFRTLMGYRQLILSPAHPSAAREKLVDRFDQLSDPSDHFVDMRLFQYERWRQGDDVAGRAHQQSVVEAFVE